MGLGEVRKVLALLTILAPSQIKLVRSAIRTYFKYVRGLRARRMEPGMESDWDDFEFRVVCGNRVRMIEVLEREITEERRRRAPTAPRRLIHAVKYILQNRKVDFEEMLVEVQQHLDPVIQALHEERVMRVTRFNKLAYMPRDKRPWSFDEEVREYWLWTGDFERRWNEAIKKFA